MALCAVTVDNAELEAFFVCWRASLKSFGGGASLGRLLQRQSGLFAAVWMKSSMAILQLLGVGGAYTVAFLGRAQSFSRWLAFVR